VAIVRTGGRIRSGLNAIPITKGGNAVVDPRGSADGTDRAGLLNRQEPRASVTVLHPG
jgi:hypothetical protein